jgi:integrase
MTPEELQKLLDVVQSAKHRFARPFEGYLRTLLLLGSRRTETLELKWSQIDLENRYLAFEKTKNDDYRTVPMNQELCDLLRQIKPADAKPDDLVFHYAKEAASRAFKRYAKAAGLPAEIHLHGTRHTYATMQLTDGVPLVALRDILGHRKIETTMKYAKILPDALRQFTDGMSLKRFDKPKEEPTS